MRYLVFLLLVVTVVAATTPDDGLIRVQKICEPYQRKPGDAYCRCSSEGRAWVCPATVNSPVLSPRQKRALPCNPGETKNENGLHCTCTGGFYPRWSCRWQLG